MVKLRFGSVFVFFGLMALLSCGEKIDGTAGQTPQVGKGDWWGGQAGPVEPLNAAAGDLIIYEVQVRSGNACLPETGGAACQNILGPYFPYHGSGCASLDELTAIKKSTLDDMLAEHEVPHRSEGITLQYIDEVVGANTVWLMPVFPHNFEFNLPDACDDLGSPYAVRDYYHVRGTLANRCVLEGRDEWSDEPCFGDPELEQLIANAHSRGMKVMLDLAFNHLGHEYNFYDYAGAVPVRERLENGDDLWDFERTFEPALVYPEVLDEPEELPVDAQDVLSDLCASTQSAPEAGTIPQGTEAVRRFLMWREAFDWERDQMDCTRPATLENQVPGFYLGANAQTPSEHVGDNFTNNWNDVKFLFNNEADTLHHWEFARTRELALRVINYYLSKGVDAFRLDHSNGLTENEWRYIFRKAEFYQAKRGLPEPLFLSESFYNIQEMNRVFDVLTEGYHHDITHGDRGTSYIEGRLFEDRQAYLGDLSYILLHLENHDEGRLLKSTTGFDIWRGATFYALAAASRGTLMMMTGQEWGEPWDLGFRRSDYLRGRFPAEANWNPQGDELTSLYRRIHQARLDPKNVALRKGLHYFPRTDKGTLKEQLFAMVRYMPDCSNTLFTFFRLWVDDIEATYAVTPELAGKICVKNDAAYRLVDVFTGTNVWEDLYPGGLRTGAHLREFGIYVHLPLAESFQWLRLEMAE